MNRSTLWQIARDRFCPYRFSDGRRLSWARLLFGLFLPAGVGIAAGWYTDAIQSTHSATLLAVQAVIMAVLTGVLAVTHTLVGLAKREMKFDPGQSQMHRREVAKLQLLRDIQSNISFAVLLLLVATVPVIILEFQTQHVWISKAASGFIYFAAVALAMSSLEVLSSIYLSLEAFADDVQQQLEEHGPRPLE